MPCKAFHKFLTRGKNPRSARGGVCLSHTSPGCTADRGGVCFGVHVVREPALPRRDPDCPAPAYLNPLHSWPLGPSRLSDLGFGFILAHHPIFFSPPAFLHRIVSDPGFPRRPSRSFPFLSAGSISTFPLRQVPERVRAPARASLNRFPPGHKAPAAEAARSQTSLRPFSKSSSR